MAVGTFDLTVPVDALFFIGSQLVATSHTGKIGVWNSMTQHWQVQCVYSGSLAVSAAKLLFLSTVCFLHQGKACLSPEPTVVLVIHIDFWAV